MKFTSLDQLQDGTKVLARFANRDDASGTAPEWSDSKWVTLYVRRREKPLKVGRKIQPAGYIIGLTPKDYSWAEYGQDDFIPQYNEFLAENYRMEILEVGQA